MLGTNSGAAPTLTASPSLTLDGEINLGASSHVFKEGNLFLWEDSSGSTGVGRLALGSQSSGSGNTAVGRQAAGKTSSGNFNTAMGSFAMFSNTTGVSNTGIGASALFFHQGPLAVDPHETGDDNTAVGSFAMNMSISGWNNVAIGSNALYAETASGWNTAVGKDSLKLQNGGTEFAGFNTAVGGNTLSKFQGTNSIALGYGAGRMVEGGTSNLHIADIGLAADTQLIRIGNGNHLKTFIAGIHGTTTGETGALTVLVDSKGQLGTASSSRRYKESIEDMGSVSDRLLALRPVTFRYKQASSSGEKPIQFGLIAEEVAEVLPELVVYDEQGRPEAVKYYLLSTLLLNELQKQVEVDKQQILDQAELRLLRTEVTELRQMTERLARLEAARTRQPQTSTAGN